MSSNICRFDSHYSTYIFFDLETTNSWNCHACWMSSLAEVFFISQVFFFPQLIEFKVGTNKPCQGATASTATYHTVWWHVRHQPERRKLRLRPHVLSIQSGKRTTHTLILMSSVTRLPAKVAGELAFACQILPTFGEWVLISSPAYSLGSWGGNSKASPLDVYYCSSSSRKPDS